MAVSLTLGSFLIILAVQVGAVSEEFLQQITNSKTICGDQYQINFEKPYEVLGYEETPENVIDFKMCFLRKMGIIQNDTFDVTKLIDLLSVFVGDEVYVSDITNPMIHGTFETFKSIAIEAALIKKPSLAWKIFTLQCNQKFNANHLKNVPVFEDVEISHPCIYHCIMEKASAIIGNEIQVDQIITKLSQITKKDHSYIEPIVQKCIDQPIGDICIYSFNILSCIAQAIRH